MIRAFVFTLGCESDLGDLGMCQIFIPTFFFNSGREREEERERTSRGGAERKRETEDPKWALC